MTDGWSVGVREKMAEDGQRGLGFPSQATVALLHSILDPVLRLCGLGAHCT